MPFKAGGGGRRDRDAFLLLLHPVHGRSVVNFTNLVVHAGVKNPLGGGRLAGINVRGNADIAVVFNGVARDINYSGFRKPTKPGRFSAGRASLWISLETSGC
jgi:hypothetical protein